MGTLAIQNNTNIVFWYNSFKNSLLWTIFTKYKLTAFNYKYKMTWQNKYLYLQAFKILFRVYEVIIWDWYSFHHSENVCEYFELGLSMKFVIEPFGWEYKNHV